MEGSGLMWVGMMRFCNNQWVAWILMDQNVRGEANEKWGMICTLATAVDW
jgi:sarcosine oxidase delta subunit